MNRKQMKEYEERSRLREGKEGTGGRIIRCRKEKEQIEDICRRLRKFGSVDSWRGRNTKGEKGGRDIGRAKIKRERGLNRNRVR